MTTIVQHVPKWLRARLQKPTPQKPTIVNKKKRQLLPTLPNQTRSVIFPRTIVLPDIESCGACNSGQPLAKERSRQ